MHWINFRDNHFLQFRCLLLKQQQITPWQVYIRNRYLLAYSKRIKIYSARDTICSTFVNYNSSIIDKKRVWRSYCTRKQPSVFQYYI